MLTIGTMPIMLKIVGKLDIKPIIPMLKNLDIFEEPKDAEDAKDALKNFQKKRSAYLLARCSRKLHRSSARLPTTSRRL